MAIDKAAYQTCRQHQVKQLESAYLRFENKQNTQICKFITFIKSVVKIPTTFINKSLDSSQ